MVLDPPIQDVARLKSEARLAAADQRPRPAVPRLRSCRDELQGADVKGRNPFKDLRVRRAVYHAINVDLIAPKVLRGLAVPTGPYLSPRVDGSVAELDTGLPFDPAKARALLADAGLPERLRGDARLRQRRLARGGLPGDDGDADAGRHPRPRSALADATSSSPS